MATVICYKTINPVYYNKGTKWETTSDTFLAYYTCQSFKEAEAEVKEMNEKHPEKDACGCPIDWTKIAYFFVDKQQEMY